MPAEHVVLPGSRGGDTSKLGKPDTYFDGVRIPDVAFEKADDLDGAHSKHLGDQIDLFSDFQNQCEDVTGKYIQNSEKCVRGLELFLGPGWETASLEAQYKYFYRLIADVRYGEFPDFLAECSDATGNMLQTPECKSHAWDTLKLTVRQYHDRYIGP